MQYDSERTRALISASIYACASVSPYPVHISCHPYPRPLPHLLTYRTYIDRVKCVERGKERSKKWARAVAEVGFLQQLHDPSLPSSDETGACSHPDFHRHDPLVTDSFSALPV